MEQVTQVVGNFPFGMRTLKQAQAFGCLLATPLLMELANVCEPVLRRALQVLLQFD